MTNELIKVQTNQEGEQRVSARELYKELGVKTRFSLWVDQNFKMFVEGTDFEGVVVTTPYREGSDKVQTLQDYSLTTDMAKNVAMMALMSRLWTGFFSTARCRYPEIFSKPGFQPKMA